MYTFTQCFKRLLLIKVQPHLVEAYNLKAIALKLMRLKPQIFKGFQWVQGFFTYFIRCSSLNIQHI